MKTFIRRMILGFAIGLSFGVGSSYAGNRRPADNTFKERKPLTSREAMAGDGIYAETETYRVQAARAARVVAAMETLGLSEDVDFAWMNRAANAKNLSFVCYSADCHQWAKRRLRTVANAPDRPEEALGHQWHDAAIDLKRTPELTEEQKIKARQAIRYSTRNDG